jgi:hypothetical protein
MRLDFTLTLPGMFETDAVQALAREYSVELLSKVMFSFDPSIVMSPLALPRDLLDPWLDELIAESTEASMRSVLTQLKSRPTFEQQWPDTYKTELARGKARVLQLESIRTAPTDMRTILSQRPAVLEWWDQIE